MMQLELHAYARRSDPSTSHDAARSISPARIDAQKEQIVLVLQRFGPLTDEKWIECYRSAYPRSQVTDQSLRSRRSELVAEGKVWFNGTFGKTNTGRAARKWSA